MPDLEKIPRVRPFLRCLNIPDSEYELLKKMSVADDRSQSAFVRKLINKEWNKEKRKEVAQVG